MNSILNPSADARQPPGRWLARALKAGLLVLSLWFWPATSAWAAVTFVSAQVGNLTSSSVNSVTINRPAGLAVGDLMLAFLSQNTTNKVFPGANAVAGWTRVLDQSNGNDIGITVFYRFADAADVATASYTFTFLDNRRSAGVLMAFRGVDTAAPINASGASANASSVNLTAPSITTTANNTMRVALYSFILGNNSATPPAGMTEAFDAGTGAGPNGSTIAGAYAIQGAAGASGTAVATAASASVNIGVAIALKPLVLLDHVEIRHGSGTGLSCAANTLTIVACQDPACTLPYLDGLAGTLTASGTPVANWDGSSGGAAGAGFVIPVGSSSVTKNVQFTPAGTVLLGTTGLSLAPANVTTCNFGAPTCTFTSATAGFIFSDSSTGGAVNIPAQVSGIASGTRYLRAVQASTTNPAVCTPAIIGQTTDVNLGYSCNDPASCQSGNLVTINSTAIASAGSNVSLVFDANASAPITVRYDDVGRITLNASKSVTPTGGTTVTLSGSSNPFVVAPHHFGFSAVTAGPIQAGTNFSATVTAYNGLAVPTATRNFGLESAPEGVNLSFVRYQPTGAGAVNGVFTGSVGAFSNGAASASNLNWSEVGTLDLTAVLRSGSYLGSGLSASGSTGSTGAVGRFIPHHFDVLVTQACSTGGYSYSGQPFTVQVMAMNGLPSPTVTRNYDGSANTAPNFAKAVTLSERNAVAGSLSPTSVALSAFGAGSATVTPAFTFTSVQTAPALISLRAIDTDNVSSAGWAEGTTQIRSGRLRLQNSYGSELLALPVPLVAQYWNGSFYVTNTNDSCTVLPMSSITLGNYVGQLNACETQLSPTGSITFSAGKLPGAGLVLSRPGAGNSGSVQLQVNVSNVAAGRTCVGATESNATAANLPWFGPNQDARATFGLYKSRLIYSRENY